MKGFLKMKDYLKGFAGVKIFPTITDTEEAYSAAGEVISLEAAVSCSKVDNKASTAIAADDNPNWDTDNEWTDTDLTTVHRQVSLSTLEKLTGGELSEDDTFEEGVLDNAPEVAMVFRGLRRSGGYRGYRYYNCRLTKYEYTLNTKGGENKTADVTLTWKCGSRAIDSKVRGTKDFDTVTEYNTWAASIPSQPVNVGK